MAEVQKKPVKIVETVLRDAHQSLLATRMTTEQMLPIVDKMDKVGYYAVECWGGATFDSCLRFLKEDPWERLRKLEPDLRIPSCRCCSAARIFLDTTTMPTTWWSISYRNPSPTESILSVSLTA